MVRLYHIAVFAASVRNSTLLIIDPYPPEEDLREAPVRLVQVRVSVLV